MLRFRFLFLVFVLSLMAAIPVHAQTGSVAAIVSPTGGQALKGKVEISGSNAVPGLTYSEISFTYKNDTTGTWFQIATVNQPVENGLLAVWDTTAITDGDYVLRMRSFLSDGTMQELVILNLRVRNYTPVETPTPGPTEIRPTPRPTITLTPTFFPTPTLLPTNPAVLTGKQVGTSLGYGGGAALAFLIIGSIYLWIRRK